MKNTFDLSDIVKVNTTIEQGLMQEYRIYRSKIDLMKKENPAWEVNLGLNLYESFNSRELIDIILRLGFDEEKVAEVKMNLHRYLTGEKKSLYVNGSDVKEKKMEWIVEGVIPKNKITVVAGKAGSNKTMILLDICARLTTGKKILGVPQEEPRNILFISAEDDSDDTLVPRLRKAGADISKCTFIDENQMHQIELPKKITNITDGIAEFNPAVVVIDPINSFFGEKVNVYSDHSLRKAMIGLRPICKAYNTSLILITHTKKAVEVDKNNDISGSYGLPAQARMVWYIAKDIDSDDRYLTVSKSNNGAEGISHKYKLHIDEGIGYVKYQGKTETKAWEVIPERQAEKDTDESQCVEEILDYLKEHDGKKESKAFNTYIDNIFSRSTRERAIQSLGKKITSKKEGVQWFRILTEEGGE